MVHIESGLDAWLPDFWKNASDVTGTSEPLLIFIETMIGPSWSGEFRRSVEMRLSNHDECL